MSEDKCKARTQERRCSKPTAADRKRDKKDLKLLHTLVIILVLFLISTIPLGVLFLVSFDVLIDVPTVYHIGPIVSDLTSPFAFG